MGRTKTQGGSSPARQTVLQTSRLLPETLAVASTYKTICFYYIKQLLRSVGCGMDPADSPLNI